MSGPDIQTLIGVLIFPINRVLRVTKPIERDSCRVCSRGVQLNGRRFLAERSHA